MPARGGRTDSGRATTERHPGRDTARRKPLRELALKRKRPTWLASALSLHPGGATVRVQGFQLRERDLNHDCGVIRCWLGFSRPPLGGRLELSVAAEAVGSCGQIYGSPVSLAAR